MLNVIINYILKITDFTPRFKQAGVEPDMPKTGRRGDFSHFRPWRALARLRSQKQKFILVDIVFGASSLKQNDFCVGKA